MMKTRRQSSTITRRRFLTQTAKGIACLSSIAWPGMKVPEVQQEEDPGWTFIFDELSDEQAGEWRELKVSLNGVDQEHSEEWSLSPGPTLHYTGTMPAKGQILYFTEIPEERVTAWSIHTRGQG